MNRGLKYKHILTKIDILYFTSIDFAILAYQIPKVISKIILLENIENL